tara:strand:- start:143 stop:463 length:321 start_codon:yes stop_codon:yes gene_type:complete
MALTESVEYDKIEVIGTYKSLNVRKATVIKKDGVEIPNARSYYRYALHCVITDEEGNFIDNPLDKEPDGVTAIPDDIKSMCNLLWTSDIKTAYKTYLTTTKTSSPS